MENRTPQQIIITTGSEKKRKRVHLKLLIAIAAGVLAGVAIVFGLFWMIELVAGF